MKMTKEEVERLCKKASKAGYITHSKILDIYDAVEDVPEFVVELIIEKPQRREPYMIMGEQSCRVFNDLLEEYFQKYIKE